MKISGVLNISKLFIKQGYKDFEKIVSYITFI